MFDWLGTGGLAIILFWAKNFNNYVQPGEQAPMTKRKKEMIQDSYSVGQVEAIAIAEALIKISKPCALAIKDITKEINDRAGAGVKVWETDLEIRKLMEDQGLFTYEKRLSLNGYPNYILMNAQLHEELKGKKPEEVSESIKAHLVKVGKVLEGKM